MQKPLRTLLVVLGLMMATSTTRGADLIEIYRLAKQSDPQLRAAAASYRAALEARPQTRALLLPQIDLSANYSSVDESDDNYSSTGYTLSLVQPLYNKASREGHHQAEATVAQAEASYQEIEQDLYLRVSSAYFDALSAIDSLEFARAEKRAVEQQLRQTEQRFEVGLSAITDVHEARAGYDATIAQEIVAQNQLDNAVEALRELTGGEHRNLSTLAQEVPLLEPEPASIERWVEQSLDQNLQLRAARASAEEARIAVVLSRSGHYPTLDLVARRNFRDDDRDSNANMGGEMTNTTIGLQFNVPLYSGGSTSSRIRQTSEQYTQALEQVEQRQRAITRQARGAYLDVSAGISTVQARKQALASATTALEATQAGFEVGTRTAVDVLNAQQDKFRTQRDYARARYDYLLSTLRLKQAAGTLSEDDLRQINGWLR